MAGNGHPEIPARTGHPSIPHGRTMTDTTPEPATGDTTPPDTTTTQTPADQQQTPAREEIDWKAEARKWETRAKQNNRAVAELEKLKQQSMTEAEKAVAEAERRARAEAAREYGARLARAEFRAHVAAKGIKVDDDVFDLIDTTKFVDESGEVDDTEIKKAVAKLAKLAPKPGGTSGGDFAGGNGSGAPAKSLQEQIAEAEAKGDWRTARRLKTQLMISN